MRPANRWTQMPSPLHAGVAYIFANPIGAIFEDLQTVMAYPSPHSRGALAAIRNAHRLLSESTFPCCKDGRFDS